MVLGMSEPTRDACLALDRDDVLAPLRAQFALDAADASGLVYLDGNSLGPLPRAAAARVRQVVDDGMGRRPDPQLERRRLDHAVAADRRQDRAAGRRRRRRARRRGLDVGEPAQGAVGRDARSRAADAPSRRVVLSDRTNFPTDLYIADTLARQHGFELRLVDADDVAAEVAGDTAVVLLTHVDYRTGRMHDMPAVTRAAHAAGAFVIWDLAHSAGAVPVRLHGDGSPEGAADFAVGCGYKYLNGGPGAPAFLWAHPRHTRRMDAEGWRQPLAGWFGHAAPFEFDDRLSPRLRQRALSVRHAADRVAGRARVRRRHGAGRRRGRRAGDAAEEVAGVDRPVHRARRAALRGARLDHRDAARARAAGQPGQRGARGRRPRHRAGADCARRDRRFPRAGHPALRLRAALHPLRRRLGRGRSPGAGARVRRVA